MVVLQAIGGIILLYLLLLFVADTVDERNGRLFCYRPSPDTADTLMRYAREKHIHPVELIDIAVEEKLESIRTSKQRQNELQTLD